MIFRGCPSVHQPKPAACCIFSNSRMSLRPSVFDVSLSPPPHYRSSLKVLTWTLPAHQQQTTAQEKNVSIIWQGHRFVITPGQADYASQLFVYPIPSPPQPASRTHECYYTKFRHRLPTDSLFHTLYRYFFGELAFLRL